MNLEITIITALEQVAASRGIELSPPQANHTLTGDLGLRSLDLAHVIAILESELHADPFARLVPITSIRTVGDLIEAYRKCLAGESPQGLSDEAAEGARRGQTRRLAAARRKESA